MTYFNAEVMKALTAHGIRLTTEEIAYYQAILQNAERQRREMISLADPKYKRNYALWHGFEGSNTTQMQHGLVVDKGSQAKLTINLVTGKVEPLSSKWQSSALSVQPLNHRQVAQAPNPQPNAQANQALNSSVLQTLAAHGVYLSPQQLAAYHQVYLEGKNAKTPFKRSKHELKLPYSVWHIQNSAMDKTMGSWMVLPSPAHWRAKGAVNGQQTLTKILVNMENGELRVVKIRRPEKRMFRAVNTQMKYSVHEADFNRKMGLDAIHLQKTSERRGTEKAYIFMPFYGKTNLLDYIHRPGVSAGAMINLLRMSAKCLQIVHDRGGLHLDFKPGNLVFDAQNGRLALIDYEGSLEVEEAKRGVRDLFFTPGYAHPQWVQASQNRWRLGQPIIYTQKNDDYAFLVSMNKILERASQVAGLEQNTSLKKKIDQVLLKTKAEENLSLDKLSSFEEMISLIQQLCLADQDQEEGAQHKCSHHYKL